MFLVIPVPFFIKLLFYIVPFPAHSKRERTEKETKKKAKKPFVSTQKCHFSRKIILEFQIWLVRSIVYDVLQVRDVSKWK